MEVHTTRRRLLAAMAACAVAPRAAFAAAAFPVRTVRIVVPYSVGIGPDLVARALADRLAEAFAEWLHWKVRRELWGYARDEQLDAAALIQEEYRGIRPAPGYPACPEHGVKAPLFALLRATEIGMSLTENFAMLPAAAVSGFYLAHPEAMYFAVGKIGEDQAADFARRTAAPAQRA